MKKTLTIAALILAAGTSVFAAPGKSKAPKANNTVSFIEPAKENVFSVKVAAERSVVIIYDQDGNAIYKDLVSKGLPTEKSYNVSNLDNGEYTVEIKSEKSDIKKHMHVYDDGQGKSYLFIQ
ncbi:MAG TPA: T9SS type A sorting domain-containing protein [Mucilaginibacter sp.]|nr:T9SS type A sorting domain-containing protein [Mucilaginibacter sp.]